MVKIKSNTAFLLERLTISSSNIEDIWHTNNLKVIVAKYLDNFVTEHCGVEVDWTEFANSLSDFILCYSDSWNYNNALAIEIYTGSNQYHKKVYSDKISRKPRINLTIRVSDVPAKDKHFNLLEESVGC